uniref:hemerythrin domain-containing protein n=1 Tax=Pararhizobium sp. IMCC3301 TaxID=3067904 RepID=UPI002742342D|nr:hemerythrin domain-containing protein [Pararhizobium sp. IMCC3301]
MTRHTERLLSNARSETGSTGSLENPLDFIADDHMREREVCALIDRLVATFPVDNAERQMMLTFLKEQLPQHLADEEIDLFPLLLKRCDPEVEIDCVIDKLESDHVHALADAPAIVALIEANEPGDAAFADSACAQMTEFANHARRHLILENAIILPIARARLTKGDLEIMRSHMLERRRPDRLRENET